MDYKIKRTGYTVSLRSPVVYTDNQARGRSGHMSHAMAEFSPGCIIDFNSNCSAKRLKGHAAYGWIEYRISEDYGKSFSPARDLPYSKEAFLDGVFTVSVEKAVACADGSIVAFCLRNSMLAEVCCEPWFTPTVIKSCDGGESWSEPEEFSPYRGRIYDAVCRDGVIYVLQFCNDGTVKFTGNSEEHLYRLFTSTDCGKSFVCSGVIPVDTQGRGYGALVFDKDGNLHMYAYNIDSEREMDHAVSRDCGKSWEIMTPCFVQKGIRNPQVALIDGVFILHGRGEKGKGFVLYSSVDGYTWDEGVYLEKEKKLCYYSNNIVINENGKNRLLIQYSDAYAESCVNVMHMWLEITDKTEE
ncbi:MAG: sialidase family protein [Eubacteriales bacterium]